MGSLTSIQRTKGIAVGAVIAIALYASGLLVVFTPLPLLYVMVARGRRDGWAAALGATAVVSGVYAALFLWPGAIARTPAALPVPALSLATFYTPTFLWIVGIGYFTSFVAIAVALGEGAHRGWGLVRWGTIALIAALLCLTLVVIAGLIPGAAAAGGGIRGYLTQVVQEIVALNAQAGGGADLSFLRESADEIVSLMMAIAPACLFVFALIVVVVNMLVGRRLIHRHHAFSHIHNVARFRLPDAAVWVIVVGGAAFFADSYLLHSGTLKMVALNALIMFGALYFFQGLAVVVYFLQGIRAPLFRTLAYVLIIFFFQTIGMLIVGIGVADVWVNFRLRSWRARHTHQA